MDPNVYKDPQSFNPDRFLGPNPEEDPYNIVFGFGRRYDFAVFGCSIRLTNSPSSVEYALVSPLFS